MFFSTFERKRSGDVPQLQVTGVCFAGNVDSVRLAPTLVRPVMEILALADCVDSVIVNTRRSMGFTGIYFFLASNHVHNVE